MRQDIYPVDGIEKLKDGDKNKEMGGGRFDQTVREVKVAEAQACQKHRQIMINIQYMIDIIMRLNFYSRCTHSPSRIFICPSHF